MIEIKKGTPLLLVRYNKYKKYDFVQEHEKCLGSKHNAWMLKTGKRMPEIKLKEIMDGGGWLILRSPKSSGGIYCLAHVVSTYYGEPDLSMHSPDYYNEMMVDDSLWMFDSLVGTWFEIDSFCLVNDDFKNHLQLISNRKYVEDVIKTTRSATLYVELDADVNV